MADFTSHTWDMLHHKENKNIRTKCCPPKNAPFSGTPTNLILHKKTSKQSYALLLSQENGETHNSYLLDYFTKLCQYSTESVLCHITCNLTLLGWYCNIIVLFSFFFQNLHDDVRLLQLI